MTADPQTARASVIERKLMESLAKDRSKPSRCAVLSDGTILVNISGVSSGLLLALSLETGEQDDAILSRLNGESPS